MYRNRSIALLLAIVSAFAATQAHAVQRTHVSAAIGDDANTAANCTPVSPCRTFQAAMGVTDVNGEVVALDSGGYGAVTITQSVALIAPKGVYAGISVFPDANGVSIFTPDISVVLRGLTINGQGGSTGILMLASSKLTVESCVITNLVNGIEVAGISTVRITDTIIRDNNANGVVIGDGTHATITRSTISGHGDYGVLATASAAANTTTTADITDSTLNGNTVGISGSSSNANAVIKISVRDSRVTRNTNFGLAAVSSKGGAVNLSASNNIVSNNGNGIQASNAGAKIWASGNTVSDNIIGFKNDGGAFASDGNNAVRNNGTDAQGTINPVSTK
jgi:Right handed beta helix region